MTAKRSRSEHEEVEAIVRMAMNWGRAIPKEALDWCAKQKGVAQKSAAASISVGRTAECKRRMELLDRAIAALNSKPAQ